jgi:hypothetical protein
VQLSLADRAGPDARRSPWRHDLPRSPLESGYRASTTEHDAGAVAPSPLLYVAGCRQRLQYELSAPDPVDRDPRDGPALRRQRLRIGLELGLIGEEGLQGILDAVRLLVDDPNPGGRLHDQVGRAGDLRRPSVSIEAR